MIELWNRRARRTFHSFSRHPKVIPGAACALALVAASGQAAGQGGEVSIGREAETIDGKMLFDNKCGMCHGPGGMGTALLARTRPVALLEDRTNLAAPFVVFAARQGIGNMPALPRGELSDAQLEAIAGYLAMNRRGATE